MRFFISRRKIFATIQVVLLALMGSWLLKTANLLAPLDHYCLRFFYRMREYALPASPHKDIVVVAIDDAYFASQGRNHLTCRDCRDLVQAARKGGAKVVGLDVLVSEGDDGQDKELAAELGNVVLPYVLARSGVEDSPRNHPTETLENAAAGLGFSNARTMRAGCRVQLVYEPEQGPRELSFPLAVLVAWTGEPVKNVEYERYRIWVGLRSLPVEEGYTYWVNYFPRESLGPTHQISAERVLAGDVPPGLFKDKLVLIGRTDRDAPRYVDTPVDRSRSGRMDKFSEVQVFANVLSTMLQGYVDESFIGPQSRVVAVILLAGMILITCLFVMFLRPIYSIMVFAVEVWVCVMGGYILFVWLNCVVDLPLLLLGVTQAFGMMMIYVAYQREDELANLSAYIPPAVRRRVTDSSQRVSLEGDRKRLTILYADLRGFTAFSNRVQDARETVSLLNEYFGRIVPIIVKEGHEGTVDKFMGDGILAFYGDPFPFPDSPQRAARTALALRAEFETLHKEWVAAGRLSAEQEAQRLLALRLGIATGSVVVGNIGCLSPKLMNYTVIGDAVNRASGLQSKAAAGQILVDVHTAELIAADGFKTRRIGPVDLKGVNVEVYELLGHEPAARPPEEPPPEPPEKPKLLQ